MQPQCLPFTSIPHTSRLFADYLYNFTKVQDLYGAAPFERAWWKSQADALNYPADRRHAVADLLKQQNEQWGAGQQTLANIAKLREGANAVVTGQQVTLFGGELFSLLKALTAIKAAKQATEAGSPAVPVFWMATEDHDIAEVSSATLLDSGHLRTLSLKARSNGGPVGRVTFGDELTPLLDEASKLLGDTELTDILRESYKPGATFTDSFARFLSRLFADHGLILIDASTPEFHRIAQPVFAGAARYANELDGLLLERDHQLAARGYHAQVHVTPNTTLLFSLKNGVRKAIQRANGGYVIAGTKEKLSPDQFAKDAESNPENFSANALLRPVVQDFLLPTLAYVGGPAEVAYFAQSEVIYKKLLRRVTPILPRISATLIEPATQRLLAKYKLRLRDLFNHELDLTRELAKRTLPQNVVSTFEKSTAELEATLQRLNESLTQLDPTLVSAADKAGSKMRYQLSRLHGRAASAILRREQDVARHAQHMHAALYPHDALQERKLAGAYFLAKHGLQLLPQLADSLNASCPDHQILVLHPE